MRQEVVPRKIAMVGNSTSDAKQLAVDIAYVIGTSGNITHWEPIEGAIRSGQLLYQEEHGDATAFPTIMTPHMMAEELLRFSISGLAIYPDDGLPGQKKGWQVFHARIDDKRVAIVWAEWADA